MVSTEVGGVSRGRLTVRMGLFMWSGSERREERGTNDWAADSACVRGDYIIHVVHVNDGRTVVHVNDGHRTTQ